MNREERRERLQYAKAAFEKYSEKYDYEQSSLEVEKRKLKFTNNVKGLKLNDHKLSLLFPTIKSDIPESARIPIVRSSDLISIADGENGTLTMHKNQFKKIYKEHNAKDIVTYRRRKELHVDHEKTHIRKEVEIQQVLVNDVYKIKKDEMFNYLI